MAALEACFSVQLTSFYSKFGVFTMKSNKISLAIAAILGLSSMVVSSVEAKECPATRPEFTLAVSIYTGWMPWYLAEQNGVLQKWADNYCINIKVAKMDYGPSITDGYMAGNAQALVVTNIDLLTGPASVSKDSTVVVVGDFSNGNDKILVRGVKLNKEKSLKAFKGENAYLLTKSVSQYVLSRGLETFGMSQSDVKMLETSDREIAQNFLADKKQHLVVTWNPMAMQLEASRGVTNVFDSSKIPGEVQDLLVVDTNTLNANPDFGRALTGAWYEMMSIMTQRGATANAANAAMAELSAVSAVEFAGQLKTTAMFYTADNALAFTSGAGIKEANDKVRNGVFVSGMMDEKIKSVDSIGIQYPDGSVQGDANNVQIRYSATFMQEAKDGQLVIGK
jgi:NitT/TauT family transport system substrate-binding protein